MKTLFRECQLKKLSLRRTFLFRVLAANVVSLEETSTIDEIKTEDVKIEEKVEVKLEEKSLIQKTVEKQIEENVGGASEQLTNF
jgi:hypothetical protein